MSNYIHCTILLMLHFSLLGQPPKYEFQVYIEDAIGNRDSVALIFDPRVEQPKDRAQFGYVSLLNEPFDSILELRGCAINGTERQSKIMPGFWGPWMCEDGWAKFQGIVFHAKHFPLTLRWDQEYFAQDICLEYSRFTRFLVATRYPSLFPTSAFTLLSVNSEFIITKDWLLNSLDKTIYENHYLQNISNGSMDTVYAIYLGIASDFIDNTSTSDLNLIELELFPIPTTEVVEIRTRITSGTNYSIFNTNGKLVSRGQIDVKEINVKNLNSGLYFLRIDEGENSYLGRIIKQ